MAAALSGAGFWWFFEGPLWAADDAPKVIKAGEIARGRQLFTRVWRPHDPRCRVDKSIPSKPGDGLGPVFNDTSCVACHSQGGTGGAGPAEKNVQIVVLRKEHGKATGQQLHPGLSREGSATVLHRSSVLPSYVAWRESRLALADTACEPHLILDMLTAGLPPDSGDLALLKLARRQTRESLAQRERLIKLDDLQFSQPPLFLSERNPPALFGASLIDGISDEAIRVAAQKQFRASPTIAGRIGGAAGRGIGRFGWQAQQSSLAEFTLTACAVELGLTVADHKQASNPNKPFDHDPGLDMNQADCEALVAYVASLPPPREQVALADVETVSTGKRLFAQIGCADCHLPELGGVIGIYSDLLLHNMGHPLAGGAANAYGAFVAQPPREEPTKRASNDQPTGRNFKCSVCIPTTWEPSSSLVFECRTPPLWGVASSAPYLHDGRAATLRDAITMHAGQGAAAAAAFQALDEQQRQSILSFLGSLVAPGPSDVLVSEPAPDEIRSAYNTPRKNPSTASFKPRRKPTTKNVKS
jgi:CxxC motif-containing protein (DUF1111 family)